MRSITRLLLILTALSLAAAPMFGNAVITIVNNNAPGVGFNDPTPAAPVGGNSGTTKGQQALNAFNYAASVWGSTLDSNVQIFILASFEPLSPCTATSGVLGSAGATNIFSDFGSIPPFPGAEFPNIWYHSALADKRAGAELNPGFADIRARFNSNLGIGTCLPTLHWYYGLDGNHGTDIDLATVLLHEFAHGLGFSQFGSVTTGSLLGGQSDVYSRQILDISTGKLWPSMTNAERVISAKNNGRVVWNGSTVNAAVPAVLALGSPLLRVTAPASIAGGYAVGTAQFGPPLSSPGVTGQIALGIDPADAAGPSTTDACSPITNSLAGKIALVDRGTCGFVVKAKNAQNAGAIAVLFADNVAGSPPAGVAGVDPTVVIPSVRITLADGNAIKAQLGVGVTATLGVDPTVRAGTEATSGKPLLYTPDPVASGSTISHWDVTESPNQLMEPNINADLTHSVQPPQDLTLPLMRDVGWFPDADLDGIANDGTDQCTASDLRATVNVATCNSGVGNLLFSNGCTTADLVKNCSVGATNHGAFVSCVAGLTNDLKKAGFISGNDKGSIQSCAGGAALP